MPDDSKTARLPGWEAEHEPGSDQLMDPVIMLWLARISELVERLRARGQL